MNIDFNWITLSIEVIKLNLGELKVGESFVVSFISATKDIKHKLNDFGITKGTIIKITGISPLGDPYHVELRGYRLAIEKALLTQIKGEKV